jgi:hypothetical protein
LAVARAPVGIASVERNERRRIGLRTKRATTAVGASMRMIKPMTGSQLPSAGFPPLLGAA